MQKPLQGRRLAWQLSPLWGCIVFAFLYVLSTLYYPGGTNLDKSSPGFSWLQNFWCNLLNEKALNGQPNTARPIAFSAMIVICFALVSFWLMFPLIAGFKRRERYIMQASGLMAMLIGVFIFTSFHDAIINLAGFFGLIALAGTLLGLKRLGWTKLLYMGLFAVTLIALNNLLYYNKDLIYYLPVLQKITFLYFLLWISFTNIYWVVNSIE